MNSGSIIGLAAAILLSGAGAAFAQGVQPVPDSNMGSPSGNTGGADNGVGNQGSLTGNAGSHSSTVTGPGAAAQIPVTPAPAGSSRNDPQVEKDPSQGGSQPH